MKKKIRTTPIKTIHHHQINEVPNDKIVNVISGTPVKKGTPLTPSHHNTRRDTVA